MGFCINDFEQLFGSLMRQKNLEENLSTVMRNMEKEFQFQSMGLFLKVPKANFYRLKIGRNISHSYEKMTTFFEDDRLIKELQRLSIIKLEKDKRFIFEKDYKQLLIIPLFNNQILLGFIFMDSSSYEYTREDEMKCGIFASLISIIVSMNNLRYEVEQLSDLDEITQFLNFQAFVNRSEVLFSQTQRYKRNLTLVMIKLANYNNIIRTIGKDNTRDLIKQIAEILRRELRTSDITGIINRDTFALLLPETSGPDSIKVVERIDKKINAIPLMVGYSVNWGIVENNEGMKSFETMINRAQDALFEASRQSDRNYVVSE